MASSALTDLQSACDLLRSVHRPGDPVLLPNAWDVATARAVVAAGFPVVATTSGGVAATLGYEDHEGAPGDEMLAAAARIASGVEVPVTVDAEAGYGMEPDELVAALRSMGAAGCNLEDSDYAAGRLRDPGRHAEWLRAVREAASEDGYGLVINARIDVFLHPFLAGAAGFNLEDTDHAAGRLRDPDEHAEWLSAVRAAASEDGYRPVINARVDVFLGPFLAGAGAGTQDELVADAVRRANTYLEAGVDCVYPITLWEADALRRFMSEVRGPVNVVRLPQAPSLGELAAMGVARVSWGPFLYRDAIARFEDQLASLQD